MEAKVSYVDKLDFFIMKSNPPRLSLTATGRYCSSGWGPAKLVLHIPDKPPEDGIVSFDFIAEAPTQCTTQQTLPAIATIIVIMRPWMKGARVYSSNGHETVKFSDDKAEIDVKILENGDVPWPF